MKNCYNFKGKGWGAITVLFLVLFLLPDFVYSVPKTVWGFVHNSDNSSPNDNDILVTAFLSKNPTSTTTVYNVSNGWGVDVDAKWTWYQSGGGGATNANFGDEITIIFLNVSVGPFAGETKTLKATLDINQNQQIGPNDFSLPVELSSFGAQYRNSVIELKWTTESEVNNLGFNVYRSVDMAVNFEKINNIMVRGAGNSTVQTRYSFTDKNVNPGHTYYYKLEAVDIKGKTSTFSPVSVTTSVAALPAQHELAQNYPNPFNPETTIRYNLVADTMVQLTIFNLLGDYITRLVNEQQGAGSFSINWNGIDDSGQQVTAGIYFCELRTNESILTRKMIYAR
ncbi:MAG TPA: T9SS type A sorting domain-containing protein [bacterium]|nr:T9SS type A sorting domain-containing protein [bacterium]HPN45613.1 T9SS type A sorting domain-containing protein [bacterium]